MLAYNNNLVCLHVDFLSLGSRKKYVITGGKHYYNKILKGFNFIDKKNYHKILDRSQMDNLMVNTNSKTIY